jgi:hypothetical protein
MLGLYGEAYPQAIGVGVRSLSLSSGLCSGQVILDIG